MEKIEITPVGVCAKQMIVQVENFTIKSIEFIGGCSGQSAVLSKLLKNIDVEQAVNELKGAICGKRQTSCSDQLAIGLENWLKENPQPCPFNCDNCSEDKFDNCQQKFNR